jgi:hypothetical protein
MPNYATERRPDWSRGSGNLGSTLADIDRGIISDTDMKRPKECINCFAPSPKSTRDYDAFACHCDVCGHDWREKFGDYQSITAP